MEIVCYSPEEGAINSLNLPQPQSSLIDQETAPLVPRWRKFLLWFAGKPLPISSHMALINIKYLTEGLLILEKTGLRNSISPLVFSSFKYSFLVLTCHSSTWTLLFSSSFKRRYLFLALALLATHFTRSAEKWNFFVCLIDFVWVVCMKDSTERFQVLVFWNGQLHLMGLADSLKFSWDLVLVFSIITAACCAALSSSIEHLFASSIPSCSVNKLCFVDRTIRRLLPVAAARVKDISSSLKEKKMTGKIIRYAIGLGGTVIFQNFFRLTTFKQVLGFFGLAIAWYANLSLIHVRDDLGVLNFLLGNVVVGSAVNQTGLGLLTWLICGLCLYAYLLGLDLKGACGCAELPERKEMKRALVFLSLSCFLLLYTYIHKLG